MENKKGSLATIFLVIAIILIVVMGALLYMQKTEADRQIAELENNASKMQEKIDSISNIIKDDTTSSEDKSTNENKDTEKDTVNDVKLGEYDLNEVDYSDPTMPNNEGCGVTLKENNECYIYEGYGSGRIGVYHVQDNKVICNTVMGKCEEGELSYFENNIIFTFEVIDNDTLKLINVENNAKNAESKDSNMSKDGYVIYDTYGLSKGMTYSIK